MNRKCGGSFFMPKFRYKEGKAMFTDEILERLFAIREIQKLSLKDQSLLIEAFEEVWNEMEEKQNATLSQS